MNRPDTAEEHALKEERYQLRQRLQDWLDDVRRHEPSTCMDSRLMTVSKNVGLTRH